VHSKKSDAAPAIASSEPARDQGRICGKPFMRFTPHRSVLF
jgi:hypothetical protein